MKGCLKLSSRTSSRSHSPSPSPGLDGAFPHHHPLPPVPNSTSNSYFPTCPSNLHSPAPSPSPSVPTSHCPSPISGSGIHTPTSAWGVEEHSHHSQRKCVAFGDENTLEEIHTADEWDRTPTEPARKLSYQDILELKEIQRSLPHANQPRDFITGKPGKHYLCGVPIGLLPLLPDADDMSVNADLGPDVEGIDLDGPSRCSRASSRASSPGSSRASSAGSCSPTRRNHHDDPSTFSPWFVNFKRKPSTAPAPPDLTLSPSSPISPASPSGTDAFSRMPTSPPFQPTSMRNSSLPPSPSMNQSPSLNAAFSQAYNYTRPSSLAHLPILSPPPQRAKPAFAFVALLPAVQNANPPCQVDANEVEHDHKEDPPTPSLTDASLDSLNGSASSSPVLSSFMHSSYRSVHVSSLYEDGEYEDGEVEDWRMQIHSKGARMHMHPQHQSSHPIHHYHGHSHVADHPSKPPSSSASSVDPDASEEMPTKKKKKRNFIVVNDVEIDLDEGDEEELEGEDTALSEPCPPLPNNTALSDPMSDPMPSCHYALNSSNPTLEAESKIKKTEQVSTRLPFQKPSPITFVRQNPTMCSTAATRGKGNVSAAAAAATSGRAAS